MNASLPEIHRIQHSFRALMNGMAYPGTVRQLEVQNAPSHQFPYISNALATLITMLIDQATTFVVADEAEAELSHTIASETHGKSVPVDVAQFIIIPMHAAPEYVERAIELARSGSLLSPETGATIFIECESIENANALSGTRVSVTGPGVESSNAFSVSRVNWAHARARKNDEFPCGIDIVLVDPNGNLVAIPRTSELTLNEGQKEVS